MTRTAVLLFFVLSGNHFLFAQCINPAFTVKAEACLNETIELVNTTSQREDFTFEWDFCAGDLQATPAGNNVFMNTNFFRARSLRIIQENGLWYGFSISATANILMRLDFGNDPASVPALVNLGNVNSLLSSAFSFDMFNENGVWHILVANGGAGNIIRYSFFNGLSQPPAGTALNTPAVFSSAAPNAVSIQQDGSGVIGFVSVGTNVATSKVVRLDFGNTITNAPSLSEFTVSGANVIRGMDFVKECDVWFGFVISANTNAVYRLNFGSSLLNAPSSSVLNTGGLLNQPVNIEIRNENAAYYAFIQNARTEEANAGIYRINFGASISNTSAVTEKLSFSQLTGGGYALDVVSHQSNWYAFTFNLSTQNLVRVDFPNNCNAVNPIDHSSSGKLYNRYIEPGTYSVVLKKTDTSINNTYTKHSITITGHDAPGIDFSHTNVCENSPVYFTSVSQMPITDYHWDFGDESTAIGENPAHNFAARGEYETLLQVTAENGCANLVKKNILIYSKPVPGFHAPSQSLYCTNQQYTFANTSVTDPDFAVTWTWEVNSVAVSDEQDLRYVFIDQQSYPVTLKASIPGCQSEQTQLVNIGAEGPVVSFIASGHCQYDNVLFTNESSGATTGFVWVFGDGGTSTETNAEYAYESAGEYTVSLTASNAAGCNNTTVKTVTIYAKPQLDFAVLAPPFSCSGSPTHFSNTTPNPTDSNIASWAWDFGDMDGSQNTSAVRNPQHTYANAGEYLVSLTATTNFLCAATLEKTITIASSPLAGFTHSPLCEDSPVSFTDAASTNKAWSWQIGSSFYATENPQHTFASPGAYDVTLSVTGTNNCIGSVTRTITIPQKLAVDFTSVKTCALQDTEFTNVTIDVTDPITAIGWDFGSAGTSTDDPAIVSFLNAGTVNVTLSATTQSGCVYATTKPVLITDGPVAAFTATPNTGEAPLIIQFVNTSINASTYQWRFNDENNQTSTQFSPAVTYSTEGFYTPELIAMNAQGCVHITQQLIEVTEPLYVSPPHPNPSKGLFTIEWKAGEGTPAWLTLVDGVGREVQTTQVVSVAGINRFILDLKGYPAGVYILTVRYLNKAHMHRLVLQQ